MSICDSDSGLSVSIDGSGIVPHSKASFKIEVKILDINQKKTIAIFPNETIGTSKKSLISTLGSQLRDSMNYGLFLPPTAGKAGKFLQDERTLKEYGILQENATLELRYKRRLYRSSNINISKLKKLHSKANLKAFIDYVGTGDVLKVRKMLNKGLDPNFQLKDTGETPLIRACSLGQPGDMIKSLVDGGAHMDYRHTNGHTPLHAAAILGNLEAVKVLLDLGQSPNVFDLEGLTPLYHSVISDPSAACAERLLFDHSIIGVEDENGLQEIHQACRFGRVQHLEYLLQYKVDINCQTSMNGNTPLHICAYLNQESCARLLLFRGSDRTRKNRAGHTAYQQAVLSENKDIAMLIQFYKDSDIIPLKTSPKYNDKRKFSTPAVPTIHRSRSACRLPEMAQLEQREDSGFHSQIGQNSTNADRNLKSMNRSLGKFSGKNISLSLKDNSFNESKKISRSVTNLQQNGSVPIEPDESASACWNNWWPSWEDDDDDTDAFSSVSGPSQRRASRASSRHGSKGADKARSQSCKRRSSKGDLSGLVNFDATFLPRMVVLQKTTQGFGFVIRGLKESNSVEFSPTETHPALQYFEEIEPNSVAAKAGLLKGDYILEINNQSVVAASHHDTVRLIKSSGDILAMKVVTVSKNESKRYQFYAQQFPDYATSSLDDSSDLSSIISSEVPGQRVSTFSKNSLKSSITCSSQGSHMNDKLTSLIMPPQQNVLTIQMKPSLSVPNTQSYNHPSPSIMPPHEFSEINCVRMRRNTFTAIGARPDSVASTDSFYPMPPPPATTDFFLPHERIEEEPTEECTLKRGKTLPTICNYMDKIPSSESHPDFGRNHYAAPKTAPKPPPPTAVPAPPPPPPPPSAPPPPPSQAPTSAPTVPSAQTPKPILKPSKPKQSLSNPSFEFDSHLRMAIALRRKKIDNDQSSVASFDSVDEISRTSTTKTTLSALKQNDLHSRSQSNRWENDINKIPVGNNNPFQRTRSDVYKNTPNANRKPDDNSSKLYLV